MEKQTNKTCGKIIIKRCHVCGQIIESETEVKRCPCCRKSFLPLNYFGKVHSTNYDYNELFCHVDELHEEDILKGLYVIW